MERSLLKAAITRLEEQLLEAMRKQDLDFLEGIFSEEYVFLGSDGSTWGKDKTLKDFASPDYLLEKLEVSNRKIVVHENTAVVTGTSSIVGQIGGKHVSGSYLFLRVWNISFKGWQVIAACTSEV